MKMKRKLSFLIIVLITLNLKAQDFVINHGPYLTNMTHDGVTIVWTTNKPALSWVEIAPNEDDSFYKEERSAYYDELHGRRFTHKTLHSIRVNNLEPNESYRYRIFSKEVIDGESEKNTLYGKTIASDVFSKQPYLFTTYSANDEPVSFLMFNDIHGQSSVIRNICKNADFKRLDFVLFNGDMSNRVTSEKQLFDDYIDVSIECFAKETPILFARGNHETRGNYSYKLMNYFPTETGNFYYVQYIGNVAFLVLDGGEDKPDSDIEYSGTADYDSYRTKQAEWISEVINTEQFKKARARIVVLHVPPMKGSWHGNVDLQKKFMPLLNKANIDLMLSGHIHSYFFSPASDNVNFPTLVNDNKSGVFCEILDEKIEVIIKDEKGNTTKKHQFNLKK